MRRVGLIIPSSNVVVEDTLRKYASSLNLDVSFHIARFSVVSVNLDDASLRQFENSAINQAIDQLAETNVEQIVFAGTAGAWLGIDRERAWCDYAFKRTGIPAASTTLLAINALQSKGGEHIGLVTPFVSDIHNQIVQNFNAEGLDIKTGYSLELKRSRDMADVSPDRIASMIQSCLDQGCDTILCFCTNFRGLDAFSLVPEINGNFELLDSVELSLKFAHAFQHNTILGSTES